MWKLFHILLVMAEIDKGLRHYLDEIKKTPLLAPEEEKKLIRKAKKGDIEAKKKIVQANLLLVVSIAKRYHHLGLPLLDLIEEGNLGLIKAVEKYNPRKGCKYATYASWWIRQSMTRALANQGKLIRIPVYLTWLLSKSKKASRELRQKLDREPTVEEVARKMKLPVEKVRTLKEISLPPDSLDKPLGKEGSLQLMDLIQDMSGGSSGTREVDLMIQHELIMHHVSNLPEKEASVLKLRFGLEDGIFRTLEEVGMEIGLTRERIRQIEGSAVGKLRKSLIKETENGAYERKN
jgi:RNA polymerase primary sigma factor